METDPNLDQQCQCRCGSGKIMPIRPDPDPQHRHIQRWSTWKHPQNRSTFVQEYNHNQIRSPYHDLGSNASYHTQCTSTPHAWAHQHHRSGVEHYSMRKPNLSICSHPPKKEKVFWSLEVLFGGFGRKLFKFSMFRILKYLLRIWIRGSAYLNYLDATWTYRWLLKSSKQRYHYFGYFHMDWWMFKIKIETNKNFQKLK